MDIFDEIDLGKCLTLQKYCEQIEKVSLYRIVENRIKFLKNFVSIKELNS